MLNINIEEQISSTEYNQTKPLVGGKLFFSSFLPYLSFTAVVSTFPFGFVLSNFWFLGNNSTKPYFINNSSLSIFYLIESLIQGLFMIFGLVAITKDSYYPLKSLQRLFLLLSLSPRQFAAL